MSNALDQLFETHKGTIDEAIAAIHNRNFYAHWIEVPSGKIYGETAMVDGETAFKGMLNSKFGGTGGDDASAWYGSEDSPYGFPLNISYPLLETGAAVAQSKAAFRPWAKLSPKQRAGILQEALERSSKNFYPIAFATMHTTGQGFMMAFQASGPHAYDRALEAIALGYQEQMRFPEHAIWEKPMGKHSVKLEKSFRPVGRGVSLAIGCSTFPIWNTLPSVFASLVTGNTVIMKPHPKAILPLAIIIADVRAVFSEHGIDPNTIQLAIDGEKLIAKDLAEHNDVKIIDYTGSSAFGDYLEGLRDKIVFTEKAGVNSVIIDSVEALDPVLDNLAFSLSLYSGQMCTTPQNIFIPSAGVKEGDAVVPYADVISRLSEKITGLVNHPKMGAGTLGAIQNPATIERVTTAKGLGCPVILDVTAVSQPGFEDARSISPMLVEVPADKADIYRKEMFGPISFIIPTDSTDQSIALAAEITAEAGAITFAAYSTDDATMDKIADELSLVGAPISFNLTGMIWVNQSATFSDFHVSGGNPSGNASLVDPSFVTRRFFNVGIRKPVA
jgi:phenylacetic acid degradation protein paaN